MKKHIFFPLALVALLLSACSEGLDDLTGTYDDISRYTFTSVSQDDTEKLGKGIKALGMTFSSGSNTFDITFACDEWTLQAYTYTATSALTTTNKQYVATLNGTTIVDGDVDVTLYDTTYYIQGLLEDASGNQSVVNFKGELSFEIGEDDIEASGYSCIIYSSYLYVFDWTTYTYSYDYSLMYYYIYMYDPDGSYIGYLQLVNEPDLDPSQLGGTYSVASGATSALTCEAGYNYYGYYMGGTSYVDSGSTYYITAGDIVVSVNTGSEDETLLSFSGTDVTYVDDTSSAGTGTGSFAYSYLTVTSY